MNIHDRVKDSGIADRFKDKNILLTGGAGYLGTNMVNALKDVECTVCRLDKADSVFEPVHGVARVKDLMGDVRYPSAWEGAIRDADIVYHFAAQTSTYVANENPPADLENNVALNTHLHQKMFHIYLESFFLKSSCDVEFDGRIKGNGSSYALEQETDTFFVIQIANVSDMLPGAVLIQGVGIQFDAIIDGSLSRRGKGWTPHVVGDLTNMISHKYGAQNVLPSHILHKVGCQYFVTSYMGYEFQI